MGFFNDLGKGIANVIKAPFEGVGALAAGVGHGAGDILHGSHGHQGGQYLRQQGGRHSRRGNAQFAMQLQMLQQAMMMSMMQRQMQGGGCCCHRGYS